MTIKDITGCQLVLEGGSLKLKLQYRIVTLYGIVGSTGESICSVPVTVCPSA